MGGIPTGLVSSPPVDCSGAVSSSGERCSRELSRRPSVASWPGPVWPVRSLLTPIPPEARCGPLEQDTPLVALTTHLLIGTTERDVRAQEVEPLDGREALHTEVVAKLDGVALYFDVFVLKKDGCIYDFVYFAPTGRGPAGAAPFRALVRGFRTLPGAGGRAS